MRSSRIKQILLILAVASVVLLASFYQGKPSAAASEDPADLVQPLPASFQAEGRLVPTRWVSLAFPNAGVMSEIQVQEGDWISEGTILARQSDMRKHEARIATAELELLLSQQAYEELTENSRLEMALAEQRLAEARQAQDMAASKARSISAPASPLRIAQARANLILAEKSMEKAQKDLQKAENFWEDLRDPLWSFVPRRAFKLNLALLRQKAAQSEERYDDAVEKLEDLEGAADEIDVAVAQADLLKANADVQNAVRRRNAQQNGPDPDKIALAQARIRAAQKALLAAQSDLADATLRAPFSGMVISIPAKAGEWMGSGQPVMLLADHTGWQVQINDLAESDLTGIGVGQAAQVTFAALPDLQINAVVESISLLYLEKDGKPTYTVDIELLENDPRLRWGLTARLAFENIR